MLSADFPEQYLKDNVALGLKTLHESQSVPKCYVCFLKGMAVKKCGSLYNQPAI